MNTLRLSIALAASVVTLASATVAQAQGATSSTPSGTSTSSGTNMQTGSTSTTTSSTVGMGDQPSTTTTTAAMYDPAVTADRDREIRPNRPLLITGGAIFAGSYLASVISAAGSNTEGDNNLYIPVVGPWLSMAERQCQFGECGGREDVNNALLVGSGVLQGAGIAIAIASAFVPEERNVYAKGATRPVAKPQVKVLPISVRAGAGLGAVGTF